MKTLFALALLTAPAALLAQAAPPAASDPKINQVIVYGDDPCPRSTADEIVVCARRGEDDRFRIPEALRGVDPTNPANDAWANRAERLEYEGRSGIESCSPSGIGGSTGCFNQLIRQAYAERAVGDGTNWTMLVEEARNERTARIDADSDAIEAEVKAEEAARKPQ